MTPRVYELYLPVALRAWLIIFAVMSLTWPGLILVLSQEPDGPPWFVAVLFGTIMALIWLRFLSFPHRIVVHDAGQIEFVAVLRRRTIAASEVAIVRPYHGQLGLLVIGHSRGKIAIVNQFTGMHQLLCELASENAAIKMFGC